MTKAIKLIFGAMICLLLLGCAKNNKNKTFLYLGGVEEDKEMKLEYKICNIDDNNIYLSFEVEKYSSSVKYIRTINVTDGGEIKEIYCNSKKMDLNNHIELIDSGTTKIDVYLTKESKGEFLDIYIYINTR